MRLAAVVALAALAAGCSISHRSGDFACQVQADCNSDRVCVDGFCVLATTDGGIPGTASDAGSSGDAAITVCPAQCSSCNLTARSCAVNCTLAPDLCKQPVTCPAGWSCDVVCAGDNACSSGIDCSLSTSCTITCMGESSCHNVTCGAGACNVACLGMGSCRDAIDCRSSCACDVKCMNQTSCLPPPSCPQGCMTTSGCSSQAPGCDTCP